MKQMRGLWLVLALTLPFHGLSADEAKAEKVNLKPVVSLIIDDLGDRLNEGLRALALPGEVTYSLLPHTPYSHRFAKLAHSRGKEVMLHQPMQAMNGKAMGPGGLSLHMTQKAFLRTLRKNINAVPHVRGINNHMGSLLTRHPGQMAWLMEALRNRGDLFFIDSGTTNRSVAQKVAMEHQLPSTRRNIFLDHSRDKAQIREQFQRVIAQARAVGSSLAIGHPYPETLQVLEQLLPTLKGHGIELIPVSRFIDIQQARRKQLWQASLSPSQKGVKSSKQ